MQVYFLKCKSGIEKKNAQRVTLKGNRIATCGICPTCRTMLFRTRNLG